ncbi:MAG: hypothetical protein CFE43_06640 [Burkholderiales bacterium PBB3]|nr:MAG: hypothetical protein CFE43_06640 [Burkholderiales bacterium PBB3]
MTLVAYFDESGSGDCFVMAGYISTPEKWAQLSRRWVELLSMSHGTLRDEVHMTEMHYNETALEHASFFYREIENNVLATFSCLINVKDLKASYEKFRWPSFIKNPELLSNPYHHGFRNVLFSMIHYKSKIGITEPVTSVFDTMLGTRKLLTEFEHLMQSEPQLAKELGDGISFGDSKSVPPLQAADLFSYWVREWHEKGKDFAKLPFPWKPNKEIPWVHHEMSGNDFKREWEQLITIHLLKAALVPNPYIFSAVPIEHMPTWGSYQGGTKEQ